MPLSRLPWQLLLLSTSPAAVNKGRGGGVAWWEFSHEDSGRGYGFGVCFYLPYHLSLVYLTWLRLPQFMQLRHSTSVRDHGEMKHGFLLTFTPSTSPSDFLFFFSPLFLIINSISLFYRPCVLFPSLSLRFYLWHQGYRGHTSPSRALSLSVLTRRPGKEAERD